MQFSQQSTIMLLLYTRKIANKLVTIHFPSPALPNNGTILSQKKSLAGLDVKTAAGVTGFETLHSRCNQKP